METVARRSPVDAALPRSVLNVESVLLAVCSLLLTTVIGQENTINNCCRPLSFWVTLMCALGYAFATCFIIGRRAESGADWWFVEPRSRVARIAFVATWSTLMPLILFCTALGVHWLVEALERTPDCLPPDGHPSPAFFVTVLLVCGLGAAAYAVLVVNVWHAVRCRKANRDIIKSVEDSDLVERWGNMTPGASMDLLGGLQTCELEKLPRFTTRCKDGSCVICLSPLEKGDAARKLPNCGHVFHRPCIDLWLLRNPKCPLCNTSARLSASQPKVLVKD